jgi:hypothetical protein
MIAAGHNIDARSKDLGGCFWSGSRAACGIFSIRDDEIETVLLPKSRKQFFDGTASGLANDVCDEQNLHSFTVLSGKMRASSDPFFVDAFIGAALLDGLANGFKRLA